jgi:hypothetical protein
VSSLLLRSAGRARRTEERQLLGGLHRRQRHLRVKRRVSAATAAQGRERRAARTPGGATSSGQRLMTCGAAPALSPPIMARGGGAARPARRERGAAAARRLLVAIRERGRQHARRRGWTAAGWGARRAWRVPRKRLVERGAPGARRAVRGARHGVQSWGGARRRKEKATHRSGCGAARAPKATEAVHACMAKAVLRRCWRGSDSAHTGQVSPSRGADSSPSRTHHGARGR